MILIAHRGNIDGPNRQEENKPEYLLKAIQKGYDVELDLWYTEDGTYKLGHDAPEHEVDFDFLRDTGMWIHCKDYRTLRHMTQQREKHPLLNFFYHTDEDYVLTTHGFIWAYPDKPGDVNTICVMPEWKNSNTTGFAGICSDYIGKYND